MKMRKMRLIIVLLFIISIPTWFIARRLLLSKYVYDNDKLVHNNDVYVRVNTDITADRKDLGKQIGIAIRKDTFIADLFFGDTFYEFKNDKEHNRIFVSVFMDGSSSYDKLSK